MTKQLIDTSNIEGRKLELKGLFNVKKSSLGLFKYSLSSRKVEL